MTYPHGLRRAYADRYFYASLVAFFPKKLTTNYNQLNVYNIDIHSKYQLIFCYCGKRTVKLNVTFFYTIQLSYTLTVLSCLNPRVTKNTKTFNMLYVYRVIVRFTKLTTFAFASMTRNGTAVTPLLVITQYGLYFVRWIPKPSSTELVPPLFDVYIATILKNYSFPRCFCPFVC